jgi:FixJ family two-component response regulator
MSMDEPTGTVFVVDDDAAVRESTALFMRSAGLPCRAFHSAAEFLGAYEPGTAGCLVLDIRMPGMTGIELQRRLEELGATIPVIFLTAFADVPTAVGALKAGAVDFLQKPICPDELLERVEEALKRDAELRSRREGASDARHRLDLLTRRETQILRLVVEGRTNRAIAADLGLSRRTVETHRANIMRKTGSHTLPDLIRVAREGGLDTPV